MIDITGLTFANSQPRSEIATLLGRLHQVETSGMPDSIRPLSYIFSTLETSPVLDNEHSPDGKAVSVIAVVGWRDLEHHHATWKTDQFKAVIPEIRKSLLPYCPGLGMFHVCFEDIPS